MELKINQQKPSDKFWTDESGTQIPYLRTTDFERKSERTTAKIVKDAMKLNADLTAFKQGLKEQVTLLYDAFVKQNGGVIGKGKGGATFYNFDRSIKIEVSVNEAIIFDENTIELAKAKLDEVLNDGLDGAKEFIKPLVMDAFTTTGGRLDTKRVLNLRRYADRVKDKRYAEAMSFIDQAIRKPQSKEYFRVWIKDGSGEYIDVQLNFASIKVEG